MNRLKLWLYILLVLAAGVVNVVLITQEGTTRGLHELDRSLEAGAAAHRAQERLMASRAVSLAALAARDGGLQEALAAGPRPETRKKGKATEPASDGPGGQKGHQQAAEVAAAAAVQRAAETLGIDLPSAAFWATASQEWLQKEPPDDGPQKEASAFLRAAAAGTPRSGFARVNDGLWYGAAQPAGPGSALALFLPVDAAWASALKREAGCDVTIDAGTPQLVSTAPPDRARAVVAAKSRPGQAVSQGRLGTIQLTSPIRIQVPLLLAQPPDTRALALELTGLPKGFLVLSIPTAKAFTSLAHYQWISLEVLAGLALVGLLLGLLLRTEVLPQVPSSLVAAAAKIERGDFSTRAPTFAGALGTISAALNKASEVARLAHSPVPHVDPFAGAPPEPPEPHFDFTPRPAAPGPIAAAPVAGPPAAPGPAPVATPVPSTEVKDTTDRLDGAEARPVAIPPQPPEAFLGAEPGPVRPVPRPAATSPGLTAVGLPAIAAPSPAAGPEEDEDTHWRAVHAEFLETRTRCGESIENMGFERFRPKLQKNKEALLQKYGCRAVRFSVYVKEGKAALKATPIK
jgi:hypothetical protein